MSKRLNIYPSKGSTRVEVSWISNLDSKEYVSITVYPTGINIAATGTLNTEGMEALDIAMTISKAIFTHGLEIK